MGLVYFKEYERTWKKKQRKTVKSQKKEKKLLLFPLHIVIKHDSSLR